MCMEVWPLGGKRLHEAMRVGPKPTGNRTELEDTLLFPRGEDCRYVGVGVLRVKQ